MNGSPKAISPERSGRSGYFPVRRLAFVAATTHVGSISLCFGACRHPAGAVLKVHEPILQRSARSPERPSSLEADMALGVVKWFNTQKGFGFIEPSGGGKDVFVHISALERAGITSLNEGQKVRYEVVTDRGKPAADHLSIAE
jgi:CspA family cold shock protein